MSLQLVLGNSGSGKSTTMYKNFIEQAAKHPDKMFFVVVPEQFTMSVQREIVLLSPKHATLNIEVLPFRRLAYRIFDELGTDTLDILEESGKSLVLSRLVAERQDDLTVLKNNLKYPGTINELKSLISELMQYGVTPEKFEELINNQAMPVAFKNKGMDVLIMYNAFKDALSEQYMTAEEVLRLFYDVMDDSLLLKNSVVGFDGFTGFTPVQYEIVKKLLVMADEVYAAICWDATENPDTIAKKTNEISKASLFSMSEIMISKLYALCEEMKIEIVKPLVLKGEKSRFVKGGKIEFLEKNLFRTRKEAMVPFTNKNSDDSLELYRLMSPRMEMEFVAATIRKGVIAGDHYKDYAVVCASLENYKNIAPEIFKKYEVPCFIDTNTKVLFNPLIEFICASFELVIHNYSYESVMRFLRTGLCKDFELDDIDEFDNYIRALGVRGISGYKREFKKIPFGFNEEDLTICNDIRETIIAKTADYHALMKKSKVSNDDRANALEKLLCDFEIEDTLLDFSKKFSEENDETKSHEYEIVYSQVMELLEKTKRLMGDVCLPTQDYLTMLSAGFDSLEIGSIPQQMDAVLIGDVERSRLDKTKTLFFVGASDVNVPKKESRGGIISELEREQISDLIEKEKLDLEIAPTSKELMFQQKYYLYLMLTKPSRNLYITYPRCGADGKGVRPSYIIALIKKMYAGIEETDYKKLPYELSISTPKTAMVEYAAHLQDYFYNDAGDKELIELLNYYKITNNDEAQNIFTFSTRNNRVEMISKDIWNQIFGFTGSVSRLEKYEQCPYAFFLNYGLKLSDRVEHELNNADYGTLYHRVLEQYGVAINEKGLSWKSIDDETSGQIIDAAFDDAIKETFSLDVIENPRLWFYLSSAKKTVERTIWAVREQVSRGEFEPKGFEFEFSQVENKSDLEIELNNMNTVRLSGKIDRIDWFDCDDKIYVKIVDYKSGNTSFDFTQLYNGIQIQLVTYLSVAMKDAAAKSGKEVLPGAMFYNHITNPYVDISSLSDGEGIEEAILKQMRVAGYANCESDVIDALDDFELGASLVAPVTKKKDGDLAQRGSNVLSTEEFKIIQDYTKLKMKDTLNKMSDGVIAASPYSCGSNTGCDYCQFDTICGLDKNKIEFREFETLSMKDAIEKMKEDLDGSKMD